MNLEKTKAALRECIHACHTRGPGPRIGQLEEALTECLAIAPEAVVDEAAAKMLAEEAEVKTATELPES